MTDIDTMPADREMDALVAEKVMNIVPGTVMFDADPAGVAHWARTMSAGSVVFERWPRPYSTDIAAAWEVVEKMDDKSCAHSLRIDQFDNFFYVTFGVGGTPSYPNRHPQNYDGMGEQLPLAICRAALKIVEVKV